MAKAWLNSCRF